MIFLVSALVPEPFPPFLGLPEICIYIPLLPFALPFHHPQHPLVDMGPLGTIATAVPAVLIDTLMYVHLVQNFYFISL